jgi:DNA-binding CsgD family transcriptional regulator
MTGAMMGNQTLLVRDSGESVASDEDAGSKRAVQLSPLDLMELLRSVFDACVQPVFVVDRRARVSWANAAFQDLVGQNGKKVSPDSLLRRLRVTDRDVLWKALASCQQPATSVSLHVEGLGVTEGHFTQLMSSSLVGVLSTPSSSGSERIDRMERALRDIASSLGDVGLGVGAEDHRKRLPEDLTDRQREVVEMLFRSMSEQDIADALFLSEHTVRNHKKAAFRRLGVHSKAELFSTYQCHLPPDYVIDLRD